jgi:osmotically-inducible protein OsmY
MKTDLELQLEVLAELDWEPSVNSASIGVDVCDGVVTLAGYVSSFSEKRSAELAVRRVNGVKAVKYTADFLQPGNSRCADSKIALACKSALQWTSGMPSKGVQVRVEKGWLTLTGTVNWDYQRRAALTAVRDIFGVVGITDKIMLASAATPSVVRSCVGAALERSARAHAPQVQVAVNGGAVTLTGTVHSWNERSLARHSAWSAPGVHSVHDDIKVVSSP